METRKILRWIALAAVLAAAGFACMPVSGLFGLGQPAAPGRTQAVSAGSYSLSSDLINATSITMFGDTIYYTLSRTAGTDYYDLYSMPISEGGVGTLLDDTNQQALSYLLVLPPSGADGLEILGFRMTYGSDLSYVRYAADGAITGTGSLPPEVAQSLGTWDLRGAASGPDGSVYLFNAYDNGCPIVKLDRSLAFQWTADPVKDDESFVAAFSEARSVSVTTSGDIAYAVSATTSSDEGTTDVRGGGVFLLDAATGALKSRHMGAFLFSDPTVIACGSDGGLLAYNYNRKALQAYDSSFAPIYYAVNDEWKGEDSGDTEEEGTMEIRFILPADGTFRVIAKDSQWWSGLGYSLYTFTVP